MVYPTTIAIPKVATPEPVREREAASVKYGFDRLFLRRIWRLLCYLFTSPAPRRVWPFYLLLLVIAIGVEFAVYFVGIIPSRFYKILVDKDFAAFASTVGLSVGVICATAFGNALLEYCGGLLEVRTRLVLTRWVQRLYLSQGIFFPLTSDLALDNPDQRIAQDIDRFASTFRLLIQKLAVTPLLIAYYTWKCWELAGGQGPGLILAFFVVTALISQFAMHPVVRAVFMREWHEGAFRFRHTRLLANAESIAFLGGERCERRSLNHSLDALLRKQLSIVNRSFFLNLVIQLTSYFGSVLSYLVVAVPIFTGTYDDLSPGDLASLISKNSFMTLYLIFRFTTIIEQAGKLSDLAGYTNRIMQLVEAATQVREDAAHTAGDSKATHTTDRPPGADEEEEEDDRYPSPSPSPSSPTDHLHQDPEMSGGGGEFETVRDRWYRRMRPRPPPPSAAPPTESTAPQAISSSPFDSIVASPGDGLTVGATDPHALNSEASLEEGRLIGSSSPSRLPSPYAGPLLVVNDLVLDPPGGGDTLIQDLSLALGPGEDLLVSGPNGVGKTSFLRAIAGLWPISQGRIEVLGEECGILRPSRAIHFLPQLPYLFLGTLREQLIYPGDIHPTNEELRRALLTVGLSSLELELGGLHAEHGKEWDKIITPGQKQRLAFARMLLHAPRLVIMDEAASAMDQEGRLMVARELKERGIATVVVGHEETDFWSGQHLWLQGHGSWVLERMGKHPSSSVASSRQSLASPSSSLPSVSHSYDPSSHDV